MFDDDNFWVKLDRDDDDIEFMNNSPTYNGSKYRSKKLSNNSKPESEQGKSSCRVPVTCNINEDYSHFNKTKTGKILMMLLFLFPLSMYVFFQLTVIFFILDKLIFIVFAICFGLASVGLGISCWLRTKLNREYKQKLAEKEKQKAKKEKRKPNSRTDK